MAMVENFIKDPLTPQVCGTPIRHLVLIAINGRERSSSHRNDWELHD